MGDQLSRSPADCCQTRGHHHETQLSRRRRGEQLFEVTLGERDDPEQHRGGSANDYRDGVRPARRGQQRSHPQQQIGAHRHHRRGMQQCADRAGPVHRPRQPERERQLCRLSEGGDEHTGGDRVPPPGLGIGEVGQRETGPTRQGGPGREVEAEVRRAGGDERDEPGRHPAVLTPPETDQDIGGRAHHLPGQQQRRHRRRGGRQHRRRGEHQHRAVEPSACQRAIRACEHQHQYGHRSDRGCDDRGQAVDAQTEVGSRDKRHRHRGAGDRTPQRESQHQRGDQDGDHTPRPSGPRTPQRARQQRGARDRGREDQRPQHGFASGHCGITRTGRWPCRSCLPAGPGAASSRPRIPWPSRRSSPR